MVLPLQWHAERYLCQQAVKVPQDWHLKYVQTMRSLSCLLTAGLSGMPFWVIEHTPTGWLVRQLMRGRYETRIWYLKSLGKEGTQARGLSCDFPRHTYITYLGSDPLRDSTITNLHDLVRTSNSPLC
jgi:hypothetical protein